VIVDAAVPYISRRQSDKQKSAAQDSRATQRERCDYHQPPGSHYVTMSENSEIRSAETEWDDESAGDARE
jgi:hypothetical protein